jgi:pimeloyl-ACP methyl ester carboxylesterase
VPAGTGPFAVYLWNHGSEADPSQEKKVAQFWLGQGFAFFKPIRSGHGGNPGNYIVDSEKAIFAQEKAGTLNRAAGNAAILALHKRANEDVVNAYKWLIAQPFADKRRIVVGGGSYGGIQTLLTAEANAKQNLDIAAFVAMSPAAESWRPAWSKDLESAIRASKGPIFLTQARNDYNLGPTKVLGPLVEARGAPSTCLLFPEHIGGAFLKSDDPHAQGHAGFFGDPAVWGGAVIDFLKASQVVPASAAGPSAGGGTTLCGPSE